MATETETLVRNLRVKDMRNQLPENVFPVKASVELRRTNADDRAINDREDVSMKPPHYPCTVKMSVSRPYIESTTVWFRNPVKYPSQDTKQWFFEDFVEKTSRTVEEIRDYDPTAPTRYYLTKFELAEIPEEYAYTDSEGYANVHNGGRNSGGLDLYEDGARMGVATFAKRPRLPNDVREDIEEYATSLPGNVVKPLRLNGLETVTAKPSRGSPETIGTNSTTRYYTDATAEKYNEPSLSPTEHDPNNWVAVKRALPTLAGYVPQALADGSGNAEDGLEGGGFLGHVEYEGQYTSDQRFIAERARWVE